MLSCRNVIAKPEEEVECRVHKRCCRAQQNAWNVLKRRGCSSKSDSSSPEGRGNKNPKGQKEEQRSRKIVASWGSLPERWLLNEKCSPNTRAGYRLSSRNDTAKSERVTSRSVGGKENSEVAAEMNRKRSGVRRRRLATKSELFAVQNYTEAIKYPKLYRKN